MKERLKDEEEIAMERYRRDDELTEKCQKHAEICFCKRNCWRNPVGGGTQLLQAVVVVQSMKRLSWLTHLTKKDNIEAYLTTFKVMIEVHGIEK